MSTTPRISIITPTFNRRTSLARAVRSVQAQTLPDYEHLIIDDCSQDGTQEFVASLADPRIRFFRFSDWRGANPARNLGLAEARSEWITFLDSDDEFLPERLASTAQAYDVPSAPPLLVSSFQTEKRGRVFDSINPNVDLSGTDLEQALLSYALCIAGSGITVRRDVLQKVGGFTPHLRRLQDRDVLLRLSRVCGARLRANVDWIKHPSPDSISTPRSGYVAAFGAMFDEHPEIARTHRDLICYQIARHVLSDFMRGKWIQAIASLWANHRSKSLQFQTWELMASYRIGSHRRQALLAEFAKRAKAEKSLPKDPPRTARRSGISCSQAAA